MAKHVHCCNAHVYLREFMLTTVILAPGACWGGSDPTVLAQNRWNAGQRRPAPARTGRVPEKSSKSIERGYKNQKFDPRAP